MEKQVLGWEKGGWEKAPSYESLKEKDKFKRVSPSDRYPSHDCETHLLFLEFPNWATLKYKILLNF